MSSQFLVETPLLDFRSKSIKDLIYRHGWSDLPPAQRIGAAYDFVRNDVAFGYNAGDALAASKVLADGYGQCNTKGTLLMALLRALNIPCRLHGFTIDKGLQRGIVPELVYPLAPRDIIHSWVEVAFNGAWVNLEGFILDQKMLTALQGHFPDQQQLCAYGVGTDNLQAPSVSWEGQSTYIQKTGINRDLGLFTSPDAFYAQHQQLSGLRGLLYRLIVRHWMNRRVSQIRQGRVPVIPGGANRLKSTVSALQLDKAAVVDQDQTLTNP